MMSWCSAMAAWSRMGGSCCNCATVATISIVAALQSGKRQCVEVDDIGTRLLEKFREQGLCDNTAINMHHFEVMPMSVKTMYVACLYEH
jgi:hypothetical protein